jgi:hypothetical protein
MLSLSTQKGSPATYPLGEGEMYTMYTHLQSSHFSARGPLHPNIYSVVLPMVIDNEVNLAIEPEFSSCSLATFYADDL